MIEAEIRLVRAGEEAALDNAAPEVFDDPIDAPALKRFLSDSRHHLFVAIENGLVVGFVSALHYEHPDKQHPDLWLNEIGVAPSHHRRGIGRRLLDALLDHAQALGCREAWVLTDRANGAAIKLYAGRASEAPSEHVMFTFRLDGGGRA
jgi:ribosomal protein S18 acetylase RimI-like enzyme